MYDFPKGGGGGNHPGAVWNDPKILRTGYGINMLFGAKRVKMIRIQLYGSDFVNSVRKKMAAKKSRWGVVTTPLGSARVK